MKAYTETEKKCIELNCPYFICWEYYGKELHSCRLQGESDTIAEPTDDTDCKIKKP